MFAKNHEKNSISKSHFWTLFILEGQKYEKFQITKLKYMFLFL